MLNSDIQKINIETSIDHNISEYNSPIMTNNNISEYNSPIMTNNNTLNNNSLSNINSLSNNNISNNNISNNNSLLNNNISNNNSLSNNNISNNSLSNNNISNNNISNNNISNNNQNVNELSYDEMNNLINLDNEYQECCEISTCCKKYVRFEVDNNIIIKLLALSPFKKEILRRRYSLNIGDYQQKRDYIRFLYRLFQVIITIGSIIVPSLLSVQMTDYIKTNYEIEVGLGVLTISIIVSICTGIIHLFKMDELYYNYAITLEKMKNLWYKYVSLSGIFHNSTHNESFSILIIMMEDIIMNQKFQEYVDDKGDKNNINEHIKLIQNYKSL